GRGVSLRLHEAAGAEGRAGGVATQRVIATAGETAVPQSVPFTSHCEVIPRRRCCSTSVPIAALVCALGVQPQSWLAQQLHPAADSSSRIAAVPALEHVGRSLQACATRSWSLH